MKEKMRQFLNCATGVLALVLAGCASHNYDKGMATAAGLKESAAQVEAARSKIDAVLVSLNDLVNKPQSDLRPQFKKFSANVDALDSSAGDVRNSVAAMRKNGNEYFARWDQELADIQNENLRTRSAARKQEVNASFTDLKRSYAEAQIAVGPLMADMRDVQKYLGTDLTSAGVASLKDVAPKANADGAKLKGSFDKLSYDLKTLGVSMSAANGPPPDARAMQSEQNERSKGPS